MLGFWWIVVIAVLAGGALGFAVGAQHGTVYEARTVIVPVTSHIPIDNIGDVAQAAFETDTVVQPALDQLGIKRTAHQEIASGDLTASLIPGSGGISVTARSTDPHLVVELAKVSADRFVSVAQKSGLGTFASFPPAYPPTVAGPSLAVVRALMGAVGAGLVAVVILFLAFGLLRPVLDDEEAARLVGAHAHFAVHLPSWWQRRRLRGAARNRVLVRPQAFFPSLVRAIPDRTRDLAWIFVGSRRAERDVRLLVGQLEARQIRPGGEGNGQLRIERVRPWDGDLISRKPVVLAFVSRGVRRRVLEDAGEELRLGAEGQRRIVVLMR
jgi:hypothetical protein